MAQPGGGGYLLAEATVASSPSAVHYYGSLPGMGVSANNIVAIASTPPAGYYLVSSNGSVYPFGDAASHGSLPARRLRLRSVSIVPRPTAAGTWLIDSDGGVFAGLVSSSSLPGLGVKVSNIVGAVPTLF